MRKREGSPDWFDRDIIMPSNDFERSAVMQAQRVMRCAETGEMTGDTRAHIQGFQGLFRLRITGILDLPTAIKIEEIRNQYA
jgi:hypothetical protein